MFVIRSYPRCGSNMLATALGNHSKIKNYGELFHLATHGYNLKRFGATGWINSQAMGTHDCMLVHATIPGDKRLREVYEELWNGLKAYQPPMILLEREDVIRRMASLKLAMQNNAWRRHHKGQPPTQGSVELDPNEAVTSYLQMKEAFEVGRQEFPWAYRVTYEQLLHRWDRHLQRIQTGLGLAIETCRPDTHKQDSRPIEEIVSNYDEFKAALSDRPAWQELFNIAEAGLGRKPV